MEKTAIILATVLSASISTVDALKVEPSLTQVAKLKRIDSRAKLPILKDKDQLPAKMSTEEYIYMLTTFLSDNNQLIDASELISMIKTMVSNANASLSILSQTLHAGNALKFPYIGELTKDWNNLKSNIIPEGFTEEEYAESIRQRLDQYKYIQHFAEGTDQLLPANRRVVDISCPGVIQYAKNLLENDDKKAEDPRNLSDDQLLGIEHLKWIIDYFEPFVAKIQTHEVDSDDKYDSGLTDENIDLLIKLTVGKNRVFEISKMTEEETARFTNDALRVMLCNASGFQRAISLLIMSIINNTIFNSHNRLWQIELNFIKGDRGSFKQVNQVFLSESDNFSLDLSFFHEITHSFHHMLLLYLFEYEWLSNISIINSRDLNLIDQYFPMLRPHVMSPIVKQIEELIDQYFGHDFEKVTEEEKQKIVVVVLEPIIRNAMMNGFGNFIFPEYNKSVSLKISTDMLTTERMAICAYIACMLNDSLYHPQYNKDDDTVTMPTNISTNKQQCAHPVFEKVQIKPLRTTIDYKWFSSDALWNSAEEQLTMQGNLAISLGDNLYYIQDRQNEQIYLIRANDHQAKAHQIASHFRYHQERSLYDMHSTIFRRIAELCRPHLKIDMAQNFIELDQKIFGAWNPSNEEKYGLSEVVQELNDDALYRDMFNILNSYSIYDFDLSDPANLELKKRIEAYDEQFKHEARPTEGADSCEYLYDKYDRLKEEAYINEIKARISRVIEQKQDINAKDKNGETALTLAITRGRYPEIIQMLLDNGADTSAISCAHLSYYIPFEKAKILLSMLLAKGLNINVKDNEGNTVLHKKAAEQYGDNPTAYLDFLIKSGATLEARNDKGHTPLLYAIAQEGSMQSIKHLIDSEARIDARTHSGESALHIATSVAYRFDYFKELIDMLIQKGLDINLTDNKGDTVLHAIARKSWESEEVIKFLVEQKHANLNIKNHDGLTPLELAKKCNSQSAECFEELEKQQSQIHSLEHAESAISHD